MQKQELYASAVLNPMDNAENLDEDYISDILDNVLEKQRARFRDGLWVKPEDSVYEKFEESMILSRGELPEEFDKYTGGQDFGMYIATVKVGWVGETVYVVADFGGFNITTKTSVEQQQAKSGMTTVLLLIVIQLAGREFRKCLAV